LLVESREDAKKIIEATRPIIFKTLSPAGRKIYNKIRFDVPITDSGWHSVSFVDDKDGSYVTEIDVGYVRAIEMIVDASVIEQMEDRRVLAPDVRFVASELSKKKTYIQGPYQYVHMTKREIDEFFDDKDLQLLRASAVG